jgi:hypothetical protein
MRLTRIVLAVAVIAAVGGLAYVAQRSEPPGVSMVAAAQQFLDTLTPEQKGRAVFPFDSKERFNWNFVPLQGKDRKYTRKGLPLSEMNDKQRKAALALVAAGTSDRGNKAALTIMSLEAILRDLEKGGAIVRDPEWYFFTVFGTPSKTGRWGWRVEGHHLSLNYALNGGQVASVTPAFFGANPAEVKAGPKKGLRTLPQAEDLARALFKSLDEDQRQQAHRKKPFPEPGQQTAKPGVGPPTGLAAEKMKDKQRETLVRLVESYAQRMPQEIATEQMKQVRAAGVEKIHFAYTGGTSPGEPYTYRVQGPTFVIEFLNTQADSAGNPANHIHSVWRNLNGDFGTAPN